MTALALPWTPVDRAGGYTNAEVLELTGISYRQLDYWVVKYLGQPRGTGPHARRYTHRELRKLLALALIAGNRGYANGSKQRFPAIARVVLECLDENPDARYVVAHPDNAQVLADPEEAVGAATRAQTAVWIFNLTLPGDPPCEP